MSKCDQLALDEASSIPAKGVFEWSLVACEPFDGESCQAGGRSIGRASHPSFSGKSFEETSWLGTIGAAAHGASRKSRNGPRRMRSAAGNPIGTRSAD